MCACQRSGYLVSKDYHPSQKNSVQANSVSNFSSLDSPTDVPLQSLLNRAR